VRRARAQAVAWIFFVVNSTWGKDWPGSRYGRFFLALLMSRSLAWRRSFLIAASRFSALDLDRRVSVCASMTGRRLRVYREALPVAWAFSRFEMSFVMPA